MKTTNRLALVIGLMATSLWAGNSTATAQSNRSSGLLSKTPAQTVQIRPVSRAARSSTLLDALGPNCGCAELKCAAPPVCGCEAKCPAPPVCGCEPTCAAPPICGCEPTCCDPCNYCMRRTTLLDRMGVVMHRLFACQVNCSRTGAVCGCDAAPVCGCDTPVGNGTGRSMFDEIPRARSPRTLPDPFLDDNGPPAPPIPTQTLRTQRRDEHASVNRSTDPFFASQIRAGAKPASPAATSSPIRPAVRSLAESPREPAPVVEGRSVLKVTHEQAVSVPPQPVYVSASTRLAASPAATSAPRPTVAPVKALAKPTAAERSGLIIPVNPLR